MSLDTAPCSGIPVISRSEVLEYGMSASRIVLEAPETDNNQLRADEPAPVIDNTIFVSVA